MFWLRTEYDAAGNKVEVYRSTKERSETCVYCLDGNCEQEVMQSDGWDADVIVHDRPVALN